MLNKFPKKSFLKKLKTGIKSAICNEIIIDFSINGLYTKNRHLSQRFTTLNKIKAN